MEIEPESRSVLISELIRVEIEYLRQSAESISIRDYSAWFPEFFAVIEKLHAEIVAEPTIDPRPRA